jgi:hypothetical protein
MQSKAAPVDAYLIEVPEDRMHAMTQLRKLFLSELKGYEDTMLYGGLCYVKNNIPEARFMSQKNYLEFISLNMK